jgi:hypothetical protein
MMVRVLRMLIIASVAALTAVSAVLVVNARYVIPETPPVIQSIHVIEAPRPEPPRPAPGPAPGPLPVAEEEPEEFRVLCMPAEDTRPKYPYAEPDNYPEIERILERRISLCFTDTPISEVFVFLSDILGINVVLSPDVDPELPVNLRLRQIKAKNALALILAVDDGLTCKFRHEGLLVSYDERLSIQEQIRESIREAHAERQAQRRQRQFIETLNLPAKCEFDWTGKSCREALLEVCTAWSIPLNVQSCEDLSLYLNAPRGQWKGNAKAALERALAGTGFSYAFNPDGNTMNIMREEQAKLHRYYAAMRGSAFKKLKSTRLSFNPAGMKLNEIFRRIESNVGILVVPDRETWDKHLTITLDNANPTLGELLDYLQRRHLVCAWYVNGFMINSYDCDNALVLFSPDKGNSLLCSSSEH